MLRGLQLIIKNEFNLNFSLSISLLGLLYNLAHLSLILEAKDLVEGAPKEVKKGVAKKEADKESLHKSIKQKEDDEKVDIPDLD